MAKAKEITTAPHALKIIPPTSEHFEYTAFTKDNGSEFLKKIFQGENKRDYSYNLTTIHERSLPRDDTEIVRIVDLWDSESTKNELPKCHIVKAKSGGNEVGFVHIGISSLEGPLAEQKMYEFQILTKDSISPNDQQEIIKAALVNYLKDNPLFVKSFYLVGTICARYEVDNSIKDNFVKNNNITDVEQKKKAHNTLVKVQCEKAYSLEGAGLSKLNLSKNNDNILITLIKKHQVDNGEVFKIENGSLLERRADSDYKFVNMWYHVDTGVKIYGVSLWDTALPCCPEIKEITSTPPTSENFEYITLTEDNGGKFLKEIFQVANKDSYSYALATFNDCLLSQNYMIDNAVCLWDSENKQNKLPKCYMVKTKFDGKEVGFVHIGLSSLEGPKAQQKMYELQTLIKDSVPTKYQEEIIKAASVEHFKNNLSPVDSQGNSQFIDSYYLIMTLCTENEVKDRIANELVKELGITVLEEKQKIQDKLVKMQQQKAAALKEAGLTKLNLDNDPTFNAAIKGNMKKNFKIENGNILKKGTDDVWEAVDMYYYGDFDVKIGGNNILDIAVDWS